MKSSLKLVISLLVLLSIGLTSGNLFAKEKVHVWKFVLDWPDNDITCQILAPKIADWVEKESNGRLVLKVYTGGTLVPAVQSFDNLRAGTFQLLHTAGAYHGGKVPVANPAFVLPMGPRSSDDFWRLYTDYGVREIVSNEYKKQGIKFLAPTPWSGLNVLSKKPIKTLEDFKGLKIRTAGLQAKLFQAVGASPVFVPGGELYLALQQGVVDAATWANAGIDGLKLGEVTDYMVCGYPSPPGSSISAGSGVILANNKAYKSLPADLQLIVERCANRFGRYSSMIYRDFDNHFFSGGDKARGMETMGLSKEETTKLRQIAIEQIWPDVSQKDEASAAYIKKVEALLRDQGVL